MDRELEPWEQRLLEVTATVKVTCYCQQHNVPAAGGCALCEGDGYRTIEIRHNGEVRISMGAYEPSWTNWNFPSTLRTSPND